MFCPSATALIRNLLFTAVLSMPAVAICAPAGAATPRDMRTLEHAGQAIEIRGLRTSVCAFYEEVDGRLRLTLLIGSIASGGDIMRSHVFLHDGQSYAVRLSGEDVSGGGEVFHFARRGDRVEASFSGDAPAYPVPGTPAGAGASAEVGVAWPPRDHAFGSRPQAPRSNPFYLNQAVAVGETAQPGNSPVPPVAGGSEWAPVSSPVAPDRPVRLSRLGYASRAGLAPTLRIALLSR